jgi:catechol 2,3-dioxygenase
VLPAATRLGPVELTVTDLEPTIRFYREAIGLRLHHGGDARASMGVGGEDLVVFLENPGARRAGRHAGLYHVALLLPSRLELARAAVRLGVGRTPIQGASDHGTHEAIYLGDPDGNGLELAADRPREQWPDPQDPTLWRGGPQPLDVDDLLGLVSGRDPEPEAGEGTSVGHLHLHVGDVEAALRFYCDVVGFEPQIVMPTAGFVSAGGYHHHVAFNTWRGEGVGPAPADAVGLRHFTVYVPTAADVDAARVRLEEAGLPSGEGEAEIVARDPSGNALRIAVDPLPV